MTGDTGSRVDFAVDLVLAQIITTMRQVTFRRIGILRARLNLLLVGMAVGTEGLLMARCTGVFGAGIDLVLDHEIRGLVVESTP